MSLLEIILIGIGLSMDCFAVSISFGARRQLVGRHLLITALTFGLFQGLMPVIGWLVGDSVKSLIEQFDHWVSFLILGFIGTKMFLHSFAGEKKEDPVDIRQPKILLSLGVATSIDALITGISFGFIEVNILLASSLIGGITFLATLVGALLGRTTTFISAKWAERAGGLVLILIGVKILLQHLGII